MYKPGWICSHLLISKCNSVFAIAACWAGGGSDAEHPPSANSPSTAIAEIVRFAILSAFEPEFRFTIEIPPISFDTFCQRLGPVFLRRLVLNHDIDAAILSAARRSVIRGNGVILAECHRRQLVRINPLFLQIAYDRDGAGGRKILVVMQQTGRNSRSQLDE